MKILIFGASGMLGHKVMQRLSQSHSVWGTVRNTAGETHEIQGVEYSRVIRGVNAEDLDSVRRVLDQVSPDVVLNCIGIVKQLDSAKDPITSISVNALFPHQLARICERRGVRFIHFSTDCVFSGKGGPYRDSDIPDPEDLYGRSKLLGEVDQPGCLTIRTSIVGRELLRGTGLFDWFFSQKGGRVRGYRRALYTGLTTRAMADVVRMVLESYPDLSGVWQVAGDPIDKFSLLQLVNQIYGLGVHIDPDENFHCDRRLDSSRFRKVTGWSPPSWNSMIETMRADPLL